MVIPLLLSPPPFPDSPVKRSKPVAFDAKSYTYDDAGNTTAVTTGSNTTTLAWDGAGRMTGITYPSTSTNSFTYNGLGQRVGKTDSTGTSSYKLADDAIDSNVLADGAATYQYGLGLVSEVRGSTSRVYHADSLGTTRAMSNSSGAASASLETDAFGQTVSVGGTFTPFGFAGGHGYQSDPDSGLMKLGHRYYDPSTGRFLSRDPIQDGKNWYTYCDNDPINAIDPNGMAKIYVDDRIAFNGGNTKGYHAYIIIVDEGTGQTYTVAGGPNDSVFNPRLVNHSGPAGKENYDQIKTDGAVPKGAVLIKDDDRSSKWWYDKMNSIGEEIESKNWFYWPASSQNSNAFAYTTLQRAGLLDEWNATPQSHDGLWSNNGWTSGPGGSQYLPGWETTLPR